MDCACENIVKKKSLRKESTRNNRNEGDHTGQKSLELDDCKMVDELLKFEKDKCEEMLKTSTRLQEIDDEIQETEIQIRNIQEQQQVKKCTDSKYLKQWNDKMLQLSLEKRTAIQNLLYFPYALKPKLEHFQQEIKIKYGKNTSRANFVNLKICPRPSDPLPKRVDNNEDAASTRSNSPSNRPISLDKMINHNKKFASISHDKKDSGEIIEYDFKAEEFGLESNVLETEPSSYNTPPIERDNSDALELLATLEFNTKDLLREELKSKSYFEPLCTLSDQYKRFYVLIETLKHKVRVLNTISETKLDMPKDVQEKLWEHSEKLVKKMDTLERTYRTLFEESGLKEIETTIVLPEELRPYEKCYRFIEMTELKKYINLQAHHTHLMKILLNKKENGDHSFW